MPPAAPDLEPYRRTPEFDASSIPAGLLRRHTTKPGVWARLHVLDGALLFRWLEPNVREERLAAGTERLVEPEVPHEVEVCGPVRFYITFLRPKGAADDPS